MVDTITHSITQAGQSDRTDTLIPQDGVLAIELMGALAGLLSLGGPINANNHPRVARYVYDRLCVTAHHVVLRNIVD